ncbi:hypothetical protein Dimus_004670 [Dionaea muscipula]
MEIWRLFALVSTFALPSMLLLLILNNKQKRRINLPPGPKQLPLIGNLHQVMGELPHVSFQRLANRYGPLMSLKLGFIPVLVVSSAVVARNIFKSHDIVFSGRPQLYAAKKLSYNFLNITFAPYGEYWREVRKITILEVFSLKRVRCFQLIREEKVADMIESICTVSSEEGHRRPINFSNLMLSLSMSVVSCAAFGREAGDQENEDSSSFHSILHEAQDLLAQLNIADYFPWLSWINLFNHVDRKLEKTFKELDRFYDEVLEEHRDPSRLVKLGDGHDPRKDFTDALLDLQKDPKQAIRLTDDQIKALLTEVFIAGSDTSSATLVWTMTELIKNPKVMKIAQDEVRKVAKGREKVEESDLPKLSYLKAVLKESFRLHPPAPLLVPRETTEDCQVMGYEIPARTRVFINAKAIGLDADCWLQDPYSFKPERFLDSSIDFRGKDFELIPFGVGRRGCPGLNFAIALVELALANLLYRFDWELPEGTKPDDINMAEAPGITTHKKTPLVLVATSTLS